MKLTSCFNYRFGNYHVQEGINHIIPEIHRIRGMIQGHDRNFILSRFLEDAESYAESVDEALTTKGGSSDRTGNGTAKGNLTTGGTATDDREPRNTRYQEPFPRKSPEPLDQHRTEYKEPPAQRQASQRHIGAPSLEGVNNRVGNSANKSTSTSETRITSKVFQHLGPVMSENSQQVPSKDSPLSEKITKPKGENPRPLNQRWPRRPDTVEKAQQTTTQDFAPSLKDIRSKRNKSRPSLSIPSKTPVYHDQDDQLAEEVERDHGKVNLENGVDDGNSPRNQHHKRNVVFPYRRRKSLNRDVSLKRAGTSANTGSKNHGPDLLSHWQAMLGCKPVYTPRDGYRLLYPTISFDGRHFVALCKPESPFNKEYVALVDLITGSQHECSINLDEDSTKPLFRHMYEIRNIGISSKYLKLVINASRGAGFRKRRCGVLMEFSLKRLALNNPAYVLDEPTRSFHLKTLLHLTAFSNDGKWFASTSPKKKDHYQLRVYKFEVKSSQATVSKVKVPATQPWFTCKGIYIHEDKTAIALAYSASIHVVHISTGTLLSTLTLSSPIGSEDVRRLSPDFSRAVEVLPVKIYESTSKVYLIPEDEPPVSGSGQDEPSTANRRRPLLQFLKGGKSVLLYLPGSRALILADAKALDLQKAWYVPGESESLEKQSQQSNPDQSNPQQTEYSDPDNIHDDWLLVSADGLTAAVLCDHRVWLWNSTST